MGKTSQHTRCYQQVISLRTCRQRITGNKPTITNSVVPMPKALMDNAHKADGMRLWVVANVNVVPLIKVV